MYVTGPNAFERAAMAVDEAHRDYELARKATRDDARIDLQDEMGDRLDEQL